MAKKIKCPHCDVLVINGMICHEFGCPSKNKKGKGR